MKEGEDQESDQSGEEEVEEEGTESDLVGLTIVTQPIISHQVSFFTSIIAHFWEMSLF